MVKIIFGRMQMDANIFFASKICYFWVFLTNLKDTSKWSNLAYM